jgi:predicted MPP superfamily phosphohydrolase
MRRLPRLVIFISIILAGVAFVVLTWLRFSRSGDWAWPVGIAALAFAFIPTQFLGFRTRHTALRVVAIPSSIAFGTLSFCFVAAIACWIVAGTTAVFHVPANMAVVARCAYGAALLLVVYGLANAARVRTTRYTVELANLPEAWRARTIVLVTDIHLGNIRGAAFAERIVARINALNPDMVLISGDMFDGALMDLDACVRPWSLSHARSGVYFVSGNHDEFSDSAGILDALRRVGVRVLDNQMVVVDGLQLIGVHDGDAGDPKALQAHLASAHIDRARASILLNHRPSNLGVAEEAGVSLQLSGHTHSGQFWPWSLLVRKIFGPFAYGLNRLGSLQVVTSSGIGTWGPPLRVATRSELVLIRFA